MAEFTNPYESPSEAPPESPREYDWNAIWWWFGMFAANAVVPTFFGLLLLGKQGLIGMVLGCVVMLTVGVMLCMSRPDLIRTTVTGACVLVFSQLFPVIQSWSGGAAIKASQVLGLPVEISEVAPKINSDLTSFVVTIFTAAFHIGLAFGIGAAIKFVLGRELRDRPIRPIRMPQKST